MSVTASSRLVSTRQILRVGSVSFLNAKPLIHGLERDCNLDLLLDVPSRLLEGLKDGRFDLALLPAIDYQRMAGLRIVPSGGIGCDGPTLTVRIFSRLPVEQIRTLACDTDSHTSVALARIILAETYGIRPEFLDLRRQRDPCEARLLIGDKVVCEEPPGFDHQLDLGAAWKSLTGLPFVFAVWMTRDGVDLGDLPARLESAWRAGLADIRQIIEQHAISRGWPAGVALQYLTCYLRYEIGPSQLEAMRRFHEMAARYGLVPRPLRALALYQPISA